MPKKRLTRSQNMARIRSSNTKPERILRQSLWHEGLRYRINYKVNQIRPDLVFLGSKVVVFVDGCQWHGCPEHYVQPRTNSEFWQNKLWENIERDTNQTNLLTEKGWKVYRVLEHEVWENLSEITQDIKDLVQSLPVTKKEIWRVFRVDVVDSELDLERRYIRLLTHPKIERIIERKRTTTKWARRE